MKEGIMKKIIITTMLVLSGVFCFHLFGFGQNDTESFRQSGVQEEAGEEIQSEENRSEEVRSEEVQSEEIQNKEVRIEDIGNEGNQAEFQGETESFRVKAPAMEIVPGTWIAVVSKNTKGEFWSLIEKGMKQAVSDVNDVYGLSRSEKVSMTFEGPADEHQVETQINTLDAVISENPSVLCLCASDMDSCYAQLEAAAENGIPVVAFDSTVANDYLIDAFRGTDNVSAGSMAGEKLADALDGKGKVAVFSAQEKTASVKDRMDGFQNELKKYPDMEIVAVIYSDQVENMEESMLLTLEENPDLAGVYCTNAESSDLYLNLKKNAESSIIMVGTDCTDRQQKAIRSQEMLGSVSQHPYRIGYETILAALALTQPPEILEKQDFVDNILLSPLWIDASNLEIEEQGGYVY